MIRSVLALAVVAAVGVVVLTPKNSPDDDGPKVYIPYAPLVVGNTCDVTYSSGPGQDAINRVSIRPNSTPNWREKRRYCASLKPDSWAEWRKLG